MSLCKVHGLLGKRRLFALTAILLSFNAHAQTKAAMNPQKKVNPLASEIGSPNVPPDLVFQIGFLGLEGRGERATLLQVDFAPGDNEAALLGPFVKLADPESSRLTLIANGISLAKAHKDQNSRENLFRVLKKTRKIEILAVAPSIARPMTGLRFSLRLQETRSAPRQLLSNRPPALQMTKTLRA